MALSDPAPTPPSGRFTPASLRRRLAAIGLRWRLVAWVAVVVLICTGITFVAVYRGTGTQLRHQIDQELAGAGILTRAHGGEQLAVRQCRRGLAVG